MAWTKTTIRASRRHLRRNDPILRDVIDQVGPFTLRPHRDRFGMLVRSIISQQISVGAARSIQMRLEELVSPAGITARHLLQFSSDELRSAGLSRQKARYVLDLAEKAHDRTIRLNTIGRRSDEAVIEELTQVMGIGRWTAQMFLIFCLARPDVFPYADLGIRVAIRNRYELAELPDKATSCRIAESWRPYASIASWYCWRSLELVGGRTMASNSDEET